MKLKKHSELRDSSPELYEYLEKLWQMDHFEIYPFFGNGILDVVYNVVYIINQDFKVWQLPEFVTNENEAMIFFKTLERYKKYKKTRIINE